MKPIVLRCFLKVKEEYFMLKLQSWQFYYDRLSNNKSFYLVASLSKLSQTLSSILMSTNCTCHRWYPGIFIHFKVSMVTRPTGIFTARLTSVTKATVRKGSVMIWFCTGGTAKQRKCKVSIRGEANTLGGILQFSWYEKVEEKQSSKGFWKGHTPQRTIE